MGDEMATTKTQTFTGKTEDAEAPFLDAAFWTPSVKVLGVVERSYQSVHGECYVLALSKPVKLNNVEEDRVSIGNLTGFRMALDASKAKKLLVGDFVELECSAIQSAKKAGDSPRPNFVIKINRPVRSDMPEEPDGFDSRG
jgi:hypothetical protein